MNPLLWVLICSGYKDYSASFLQLLFLSPQMSRSHKQQRGISTVLVLTEIPAVVLSPSADHFAVRHGQAGELILPALLIPQAVFRIKCVLFHHLYLVSFLLRVVCLAAFACSTNALSCR